MTYEKLLMEAENDGLKIKEKELDYGFKGLYKDGRIIIDENICSSIEKRCILAEELGHHYTSYGNVLDQTKVSNAKQEKRARNWGYEKLVGIIDLINAFNYGIRTKYEMSEYLNITEEFLDEAIQHYKEKYGVFFEIDEYLIYFEPSLTIMKKIF